MKNSNPPEEGETPEQEIARVEKERETREVMERESRRRQAAGQRFQGHGTEKKG